MRILLLSIPHFLCGVEVNTMKERIKWILHTLLGFDNYLYLFSKFKINTLAGDKKEGDFMYFLKQLPDNGTILDIGANIGIMTYYLSTHLHRGKVLAFEPMPFNLETLRKIVKHYRLDNVEIHDYALGQESGTVDMILPVVDSVKLQGLSHVKHDSITEYNEGETFSCDCKTLDELDWSSYALVTGIKIDVENFEFFVLKGGEKLLARDQPIIYIELWDNENRAWCFELLKSIGYRAYVVMDGVAIEYDPSVHEKQNFIFKVSE